MILPLFLFWVPFVWLLSFLPPSLPHGLAGDGACAAWTLTLFGSAQNPLPLLVGKGAYSIFPFGTPAFRLNVAGAVLSALTPLLVFRIFSLAKPRPTPGPTLLDLHIERHWATVSLLAIAVWVLSPPFLHGGTRGIPPALNLLLPILTLERVFTWRRTPRPSRGYWVQGVSLAVAGGLTLSLDPRWTLFLPARCMIRRRPWGLRLIISMGLAGVISFLLPWGVLASFQAATAGQLFNISFSTMGAALFPQKIFWGGDPAAFLQVGGLILVYGVARALHSLSNRFPRRTWTVTLLVLLLEWTGTALRPPPLSRTESEINDLFRSIPANSTLLCSREDTLGAATYVQWVLGKRRDIRLRRHGDPTLTGADFSENLFIEPNGKWEESQLPKGFVFQPLSIPLTTLSSPLAQVSQGRVPLLLAESQAPSPFLGRAHERLGMTFAHVQIPDQAEEEFLAALACDPQNTSASESLGRLWMDYGDKKRAAAALHRVAPPKRSSFTPE